jgi:hypothetical protein
LQLKSFHENSQCFKSFFICLSTQEKTCGQVNFLLEKSFFLIKCSPKGLIIIKWRNGDKELKDCSPFCGHFHFLIKNDFWDEIFYNMLLKIHIYFLIHHIFCIKISWITNVFLKMYNFYQIFLFILKNYLNFKLYENMLIIECFILVFINYNFVLDVTYITPHLHVVKDFWN